MMHNPFVGRILRENVTNKYDILVNHNAINMHGMMKTMEFEEARENVGFLLLDYMSLYPEQCSCDDPGGSHCSCYI